jgi:hypothetical protein
VTEYFFYGALGYWKMEAYMSVMSHIIELQKKHDELSLKVEKAQQSLGLDDFEVVMMKKQKLRLKEKISRLSP